MELERCLKCGKKGRMGRKNEWCVSCNRKYVKNRKCLSCGHTIVSEGNYNRVCASCREYNKKIVQSDILDICARERSV